MASQQKGFDNLAYASDPQNEATRKQASESSKAEKKQKDKVKCMKCFLVLFFLVTVGLVIAVIVLAMKDDMKDEDKIMKQPEPCITHDCALAAARIIEGMDMSIDPCVDFYNFTCGGWKKKNPVPADRSSNNNFNLVANDVLVVLKYLLEGTKYSDVEAVQKAKDVYSSCLDTDLIEQNGMAVAFPLMEELGGWPIIGANPGGHWNESDFNLASILTKLRKYNNNPIIDMYVGTDLFYSDKRIIYVDQPYFGMPTRLFYLTPDYEDAREAYVTFGKSVAVLFGANEADAEVAMRDILQLETDLANITAPQEERRDYEALYNNMTILDLAQNSTEPGPADNIQFSWIEYVSGIMNLDHVNIPINQSEVVVNWDVNYFQNLFSVLQKYDKRVIANYLVWYILKNRASNLDTRFVELVEDYNSVLYGIQASSPRWQKCASYINSMMDMAVGHMFVLETFDDSAKDATLDMIRHIRNAFKELLEDVDWMDDATRAVALEKMEAVKAHIGFEDDYIDPVKVNKRYETVTVDPLNYYGNVLSMLRFYVIESLKKLREPVDKKEMKYNPSIVNAFYSGLRNAIVFPAGILQPPFYSKEQPQAMNFGGIGVVIGHEITHGFDDQGRQFDKDGNLAHWWDSEIIDKFKEKAQCMIDQYGSYVVATPKVNKTLNGINTQGENIADNGGLLQSYRAYRDWVEARGSEEPMLAGLDFTGNQLFFISYGQTWCDNTESEALISAIDNGVHSIKQFRVIGPLQNSKEFSQAFGCNKRQYMNPAKKCKVW